MQQYKPGDVAPISGNYCAYDKKGNNGGCCYLQKGQIFPATQHKGSFYVLEE